MNHEAAYLNTVTHRRDVRLWQSVVIQALLDATTPNVDAESDSLRAAHWFWMDSKDFQLVCEYAVYESDWVRNKAMPMILANLPRIEAYEAEQKRRHEEARMRSEFYAVRREERRLSRLKRNMEPA